MPLTVLALSRRLSRHCSSAGCAAVPSSSTHTPVLLVEIVEVPVAGAVPDPRLPPGGWQPMRAFHPADVAVFEYRQGALTGVAERDRDFRRQRIFLRSSMAARIRSAVVRRRPMARQIHAYASSNVSASWTRSSTVSSTLVHGGSIAGCLVRRIASDRWMTTPGIFACAGCRDAGTVIVMTRTRLVDQAMSFCRGLVAERRRRVRRGATPPTGSSPGEAPRRTSRRHLAEAAATGHFAPCRALHGPDARLRALTTGDNRAWRASRSRVSARRGIALAWSSWLTCLHAARGCAAFRSLWITSVLRGLPVDN